MGFLKKLKIYNDNCADATKQMSGNKNFTEKEFTVAAIKKLAEASNALVQDTEDDFGPEPELFKKTLSDDLKKENNVKESDPKTGSSGDGNDNDMTGEESETSRKKQKKQNNTIMTAAALIAGVLFAIFLAVFIYGCVTAPKDRMGRNLYIENVNVSGMTFDEALAAVSDEQLLDGRNITVTCAGRDCEINGVEIGLSPRMEDTVDKAMRYGKTTNPFINGLAETLQIFHRHTVMPSANVDEAVLREKLQAFGVEIYGELIEHQLEIGDGIVICTPGHTGFDNNTDKAYDEVTHAINSGGRFNNIPVTLSPGAPKPLTVDDIDDFTYLDPKNAYYSLEGGNVVVMPETPGRFIDRELAQELVKQVVEGGEAVTIPFTYSPAELTADVLQAKLFNATIGSYSTSYGTSNANRCANIANAAKRINGKVLMPGDVFSFNATVGPRSVANGFYTAKEYVSGETVDGIGGGTCQVSSTLYNACIYSDLSIVSRTSHMFPVGYCPLGQDATVAYGSVDYKFVNSMDYPIKITAVTGGYKLTVSIIGTQRDDPRRVKVINTTQKVGEDTRVTTVREVYNSAGEKISSDTLPGSYYKPHD